MPAAVLASYRGRRIGFVPQNPAMGLSPHLRIGSQFTEVTFQHRLASTHDEALALAREHFALVGLPSPEEIGRRYPHELSGGQQQRVCIALAIACRPELLVLDEPTTGLDVTTQMRIVELLKDLRARFEMAMLYVTHDLGLLAQIADRVGVMYAGRLVEIASTENLFAAPRHPYTRGLIASVPSLDATVPRSRPLRGLLERRRLPPGCAFSPRCDYARPSCANNVQSLEPVAPAILLLASDGARSNAKVQACAHNELVHPSCPGSIRSTLIELEQVSLAYGKRSPWVVFCGLNASWSCRNCHCRSRKVRYSPLSGNQAAANPR